MSYTELLPQLFQNLQLAPNPIRPMQPPYPRWHDPNARCDYHAGAIGHTTKNCTALKYKVQEFIDQGWLNFKKEEEPNVNNNPLPNHQVNVVECQNIDTKIDAVEIVTPKEHILKILLDNRPVSTECQNSNITQEGHNDNLNCTYHAGAKGHSLDQCRQFCKKVQKRMDSNVLTVLQTDLDDEINVVEGLSSKKSLNVPIKPLTIFYREKSVLPDKGPKSITIQMPTPFEYKSSKVVPWKYEYKVTVNPNAPSLPVDNISKIGGLTRSGRCYTPNQLLEHSKNKEEQKEKDSICTDDDGKVKESILAKEPKAKQYVSGEEAEEFLRLVKQSEYKVVDQLARTPAKISILSLLLTSEVHRNTIMEALNQAYVSKDITTNHLDSIVGNITASNTITFTDEEIPLEGTEHTKALYIFVKCKNFLIAKVLIDNKSSLNIMPKSTLEKLPVDISHMKPSNVIVRAFDGARSQVIGDIEIPIQIGPCTFDIHFQVMDIPAAYSFLLG